MPPPRPEPRDSDNAIDVRVVPRAGRSGVAGTRQGAVLVRLAAAPVDGAANAELIDVLARALGRPKRDIQIVAGERARSKRVRVAGLTRAQVLAALASKSRTLSND